MSIWEPQAAGLNQLAELLEQFQRPGSNQAQVRRMACASSQANASLSSQAHPARCVARGCRHRSSSSSSNTQRCQTSTTT
jgi:hypothetical protein